MAETIVEKKVRKRKPYAVVLDADDVVFDFIGGLCQLYNKHHGTALSPSDLTEWDWKNLDFKDARGNVVRGVELRKEFEEYENGIYVGLEPVPYAIQALNLIRKLGYKIFIITARHCSFGKHTELSLMFKGIPHDEVFHKEDMSIEAEKYKVAKIDELSKSHNIALFADDKLSTAQAVASNCKVDRVYLVNRPHNKNMEAGEDVTRIND